MNYIYIDYNKLYSLRNHRLLLIIHNITLTQHEHQIQISIAVI